MLTRFSNLRTLSSIESTLAPASFNITSLYAPQQKYYAATQAKSSSASKREKPKQSFRQRLYEKNKERVKHLAKEMVHLVVHGSKSAYKDMRYLAGVVSSKPKRSYTIEEIRENARIVRDLIKFVPFYAALLIPAGEIALLPYIYLFPRAIPSYFMTENALKEVQYKYVDNQARAQKYLKNYLLARMIECGYDPSHKDKDSMKQFFVENRYRLLPLLSLDRMDSEALRNASDFLMFEYVEGTFILNLLYKTTVNLPAQIINAAMWVARKPYRAAWTHPFFTHTFRMNFGPFEELKTLLIKSQLKRQLRIMKHQNYSIILNQYGSLSEDTVLSVAHERGFVSDKEEEARKWLKDDWVKISKDNVDNENFLFWYSVIVYEYYL